MVEFVKNLLRYPAYLLTLIAGIFLAFLKNFVPYFKNPVTATAIVGIFIGIISLMYFTLRAMLGMNPV